MKILAVDTTAKTAYVALAEFSDSVSEVKILAEYTLETGTHSTTLLPMIESVFSLTESGTDKVDIYAVSEGPGSFTGIRIGVAAVKGLAFVKSTACVGVSSLDALAYGCKDHRGLIIPAIDARRETVYSAVYISDGRGSIEKITADNQIPFADLLDDIDRLGKQYPDMPVIMLGDVYHMYFSKYSDRMSGIICAQNHAGVGAAFAAAEKWLAADDKSQFTDSALCPSYLKKSQAERERDEMLASKN